MRMRVPVNKFKVLSNAFDFNFFDFEKRIIKQKDPGKKYFYLINRFCKDLCV